MLCVPQKCTSVSWIFKEILWQNDATEWWSILYYRIYSRFECNFNGIVDTINRKKQHSLISHPCCSWNRDRILNLFFFFKFRRIINISMTVNSLSKIILNVYRQISTERNLSLWIFQMAFLLPSVFKIQKLKIDLSIWNGIWTKFVRLFFLLHFLRIFIIVDLLTHNDESSREYSKGETYFAFSLGKLQWKILWLTKKTIDKNKIKKEDRK